MTQKLSPAQLALLEKRRQGRQRREAPTITTGAGTGGPLTPAQERLWFLHQLDPTSARYNVYGAIRLRGPLSQPALTAAVEGLHARHGALHTVIETIDGKARQRITETAAPTVMEIDLRSTPAAERPEEERRRAERIGTNPFDLTRGPVYRVALLRTGEEASTLCVAMHHILSDGWSLRLFFQELGEFYRSHQEGREPRLAPTAIRFLDYALWQRREGNQASEKDLEYWRQQLADAPTEITLPTDRPRPRVQSFHGAVQRLGLPEATAEQFQTLGRQHQASLFMALLAALAVLLSRLTGQRSVCIGMPATNRRLREVQDLIGFFVDSLVIHCRVEGEESFHEIVEQVRQRVLEALDHRSVSFDRLVEAVQPDRELTRNPLFQVMFDLREGGEQGLELPGIETEVLDLPRDTSKFDWTVTFHQEEGLQCEMEYSTDLFDHATIKRSLGHLEGLFTAVAREPDTPVAQLPLLSPGERHQLLAEWAGSTAPYPRETTVHRRFEEQAVAHGEARAAVYGSETLTYDGLNRRANRLARHLRRSGVQPGERIAFRLPPSIHIPVAMLAILKVGGTYVPLDPEYPEARLALMYADSGAVNLLTTGALATSFATAATIPLDDPAAPWEQPGREEEGNLTDDELGATLPADASAYFIYTSGSTGKPKAVDIPHRGITRLVLGTDYVQIGPADRVAQLSNSSFDAATFEIWAPLLSGGTVVGIDREVSQLPERFARQVREMEIDTVFLTTALFNVVAREEPTAFAPLREVLFGGEACDPMAVTRVLKNGPPRRLLHVYGPTESTTYATWFEIDGVSPGSHTLPIGRPVANTRCYVVDLRGQPVPVGVPGELWITGDGLAKGYAGRPELTAERFVPDPFSSEPQARAYRTGDLVRFRSSPADGAIEFLGRIDQQLKISGFRIEPGEIESALLALPEIEACFVEARPLPSGEATLVAYTVPTQGMESSAEAAARQLELSLPRYMVPSFFVTLPTLPLNANGKVDRGALPAPDFEGNAAGEGAAQPRSFVEQAIARIWEDVLALPRVGIHANFFSIGGQSLLATQVITRVRDHFDIDLPIQAIFDRPTIAGLAEKVEALRGSREAGWEAVAARPEEMEALDDGSLLYYPTSLQRRTWELEIAVRGSFVNHMQISYFIEGEVDIEALRAAYREVVRRHEGLRAGFPEVNGEPQLRIYPDLELEQPLIDLSDRSPEEAEEATLALAVEEFRRPFDIYEGPLVRSIFVRLSPTRHAWLRPMHHIIYDGWSEGVVLRDLIPIYQALSQGQAMPELPPPGRFTDYVAWQRHCLEGEIRERLLCYWERYLGGCKFDLQLPTDRPVPEVAEYNGGDERKPLSRTTSSALKALGAQEDASLFMVLFAGLQVLLHSYTGQLETVLSTPVANRHHRRFEDAVGLFVSDILLRTDLSGNPIFRDLVAQVRQGALDGYRHQDLPYEIIEERLQPDRNNPLPLFRAQFLHQNMPMPKLVLGEAHLEPMNYQGIMAPFDLTTEVTEREGRVVLRFNYKLDVFDRATIRTMLDRYAALLEIVLENPDRRLSQLVTALESRMEM